MRYLKATAILAAIFAGLASFVFFFFILPELISDRWGWILPISVSVIILIWLIGQLIDPDKNKNDCYRPGRYK